MAGAARKKEAGTSEAQSADGVIVVDREVTIQTIGEFHADLLSTVQSSQELVLDIRVADQSDLTFIQVIESVRRTASRDGKHVALSAPAAGGLRVMLERGGFVGTPENRQFWFHEGSQ
jgi:hypothetical protein